MNRIARTTRIAAAAAIGLTLALPASQAFAASKKTENAIIGGALGALAGALLTHGDTTGIVAGAAGGALIGSAATKRNYDRRYSSQPVYSRYQQPAYGYGRGYETGYDRRDRRDYRDDYRYERPVNYGYYGR